MRSGKIERKTLETEVNVELDLDGQGKTSLNTGIGFLIICWILSAGLPALI